MKLLLHERGLTHAKSVKREHCDSKNSYQKKKKILK